MASNLNIAVTADATQMRSALALAQADLKAYGAEVRATAVAMRTAGDAAKSGLITQLDQSSARFNSAKAAVGQYRTALGEGAAANRTITTAIEAETGAMVNSGTAREAMVLAHEMMQGQFNRVGGSAMVMAERLGSASLAVKGLVAAFALAALGAASLIEWLGKVASAKDAAQSGRAAFNIGISPAETENLRTQLVAISGVSTEMSGQVANAFMRMQGVAIPTMRMMAAAVQPVAAAIGKEFPAAAMEMAVAMEQPTLHGRAFLETLRASNEQLDAFDKAVGDNSPLRARAAILSRVNEISRAVTAATGTAANAAETYRRTIESGAIGLTAGSLGAPFTATTAAIASATGAVDHYAEAIAALTNTERQAAGSSWIQIQEDGVHKLELETLQAARKEGLTWQAAHERELTARAKYWSDLLNGENLNAKQREDIQRRLITAQEALETAKIKIVEAAGQRAYEAVVAAYDAQIGASRSNFARVVELEKQKLDFIRQARGENSREYATAAKSADESLLRSVTEQMRQVEEAERRKLEVKRASLAEQVAMGQITKTQEMEQLQQFVSAQRALELQALDNLIAGLDEGTNARAQALRLRTQLEEKFDADLKKLRAEEVKAAEDAAHKIAQGYLSAFSGVEGAFKSTITGMLTRTATLRQGMQKIATSILEGFVDIGLKMLGNWMATQIAMTMATTVQSKVRNAIDAGQSGMGALLGAIVARWTAGEAAKTGAVAAGATARTGIEATAAATEVGLTTTATAMKTAIKVPAAVAEITMDAGTAAAGAFSSQAAIPIVGPALGAAAAATAMAAVMGFASFAKGSWDVPEDMMAQIHKGEMIVPAGAAARIRDGGGSSQGGSASLHYAPSLSMNGAGNISRTQALNFFRRHGDAMMGVMATLRRNGHPNFIKA
jgi:hypothetical protein